MRRTVLIAICFLLLFSGLSACTFLNWGTAPVESGSRINPYRELTEEEQILGESLRYAIMEMDKILDCEVAVLLSLDPVMVFVVIILEDDEEISDFSDSEIQAVKTIISSVDISMNNENITINEDNISISVGHWDNGM